MKQNLFIHTGVEVTAEEDRGPIISFSCITTKGCASPHKCLCEKCICKKRICTCVHEGSFLPPKLGRLNY